MSELRYAQVDPSNRGSKWPFVFRLINAGVGHSVFAKFTAVGWCEDQFGPIDRVNPVINRRWHFTRDRVMFRTALDATAFRLRWC